jgi:hypothetical protein
MIVKSVMIHLKGRTYINFNVSIFYAKIALDIWFNQNLMMQLLKILITTKNVLIAFKALILKKFYKIAIKNILNYIKNSE